VASASNSNEEKGKRTNAQVNPPTQPCHAIKIRDVTQNLLAKLRLVQLPFFCIFDMSKFTGGSMCACNKLSRELGTIDKRGTNHLHPLQKLPAGNEFPVRNPSSDATPNYCKENLAVGFS
jgi:hypothetical protein